jgi:hypothetical protein
MHPRCVASAPLEGRTGAAQRRYADVPAIALSIEGACAALDVSWDFWRANIEPEVRVIRVGRLKRVAVAELERWATEHGERVV